MLALIRLVHTLIYFVMSASVLYLLYCGITDRYSSFVYVALALVLGSASSLLGTA